MTNTSGDNWSGLIPAQAGGTTVYYYIEGTAVGGKQVTHPMPAPAGYHDFKVTGGGGGADIAEQNPLAIMDIYPNPANSITVIPVNTLNDISCTIYMTNMLGDVVATIYDGQLSVGDKNFFIDAGEYAAGMYQVVIQTENYKVQKKLMIK